MTEDKTNNTEKINVSWHGYVALIFAILFFSGMFVRFGKHYNMPWLEGFDFSTLQGSFGTIADKITFIGTKGSGAKHGFLFALTLIPSVMLALGIVEVVEHYGGIKAAQKLLTPILRPLLGLPGNVGLALISSLQSTDAGASMTKSLYENGTITENERTIFSMFQFTAGATITNLLSSGSSIIMLVDTKIPTIIAISFVVIFSLKIFAANLMRLYLKVFAEKNYES